MFFNPGTPASMIRRLAKLKPKYLIQRFHDNKNLKHIGVDAEGDKDDETKSVSKRMG